MDNNINNLPTLKR